MKRRNLLRLAATSVAVLLSGCASMIGQVTSGLATDLSAAILDSEDPAVVRDGAPAYLIMLDALLRQSADNADLLRAAASLNGAYSTAFVTEPDRQKSFAAKSFDLAARAACVDIAWLCDVRRMPFDDVEARVATLTATQVPAAYALATAWATWIQAHADDWTAVADLGRVRALMVQVLVLDETYDNGGPHLYMGVFETVVPPSLGGRPEVAREHFERAIEISGGTHLLAKVFYADDYGRTVFDRELHDRLLGEVLEADIRAPGLSLMNAIAKERARELLASADDFF